MKIGIIGHGEDKFSAKGKKDAKELITNILIDFSLNCLKSKKIEPIYFVSGHSPVGGIDIYGEEEAKRLGFLLDLKIPKQNIWDAEYGFKQRNLDIARDSDILHVILVDKYPKDYRGRIFSVCYHCLKSKIPETMPIHVKSGACWTASEARKLGKEVMYHIIKNE